MNIEKMFALNTPENEMMFELMLVANDEPNKLEELVAQGWGIYPVVLNALIGRGHAMYLRAILQQVYVYEKYPIDEMQSWMEAFFEQNWKHQVAEFGMQKIAAKYLTYTECLQSGFSEALDEKNRLSPWETFAKSDGIESVKTTYLHMCNSFNQGSSEQEKERIYELERFLCYREEYEFLYNRQCWQGLSSTLGGVKYIAETKHYMNGLAECVFNYHNVMLTQVLDYCISVLDKASLDDNYRPRYQEWKAKNNIKH